VVIFINSIDQLDLIFIMETSYTSFEVRTKSLYTRFYKRIRHFQDFTVSKDTKVLLQTSHIWS